jgi:ribose transport system permease protein
MTADAAATSARQRPATVAVPRARLRPGRHRGLLIACAVFALLLLVVINLGSTALTYYDLSQMATTGATLAIAAAGQTLVVLTGGFDLSAGAVVSLVDVVLATGFPDPTTSPLLLTAVGVGIGMATGAFNAVFVALLRLQPIVVTLSTMFIVQGITLLVQEKPGGTVPPTLTDLFLGDAIPNLLPRPILLLAILFALWAWLRRTRLGTAIYAVGSDVDAARAAGVATRRVLFAVYVIAGGCYGLAGTFISAQTGSGDPLVGNPLLLQVFAAIVVGGTRLGGGRGGVLGAMIGAYILMLVVNILLVLNVSAYYSTIAEGAILILAVLGAAIGRDTALAQALRHARAKLAAWRAHMLPAQRVATPRRLILTAAAPPAQPQARPGLLVRHAGTLRFALPAYVCFVITVLATQLVLGHAATSWR